MLTFFASIVLMSETSKSSNISGELDGDLSTGHSSHHSCEGTLTRRDHASAPTTESTRRAELHVRLLAQVAR